VAENVSAEHALDDVGAVEAVHAVGANNGGLFTADFDAGRIAGHIYTAEVAMFEDGPFKTLHQQFGPMPLQTLGLVMEVEIDIMESVEVLLVLSWLNNVELLVCDAV